ncbi:hypothetical protein LguiB_020379 [Lonicera macranthoides]
MVLTCMAEREVKRENKLLVKEWERNQREVEEEKKRLDLELQKGKFQAAKRLQDEADKEQNHQDKEEPALRKQLALQKQASLMERFHKRSKNSSSTSHNDQFFNKSNIS